MDGSESKKGERAGSLSVDSPSVDQATEGASARAILILVLVALQQRDRRSMEQRWPTANPGPARNQREGPVGDPCGLASSYIDGELEKSASSWNRGVELQSLQMLSWHGQSKSFTEHVASL